MTLKINKKQRLYALFILFAGVFGQAAYASEDTSNKYFSFGFDKGSYSTKVSGGGNEFNFENDGNSSFHVGLGYELSSNLALEFRYRGVESGSEFESSGGTVPAALLQSLNEQIASGSERLDSGQVLLRLSFPIEENLIPYIMGGVNKYEGSAPAGLVGRIGINLFGSATTALNIEGGVVATKDEAGNSDLMTFDKSYGFGFQYYFGGGHK